MTEHQGNLGVEALRAELAAFRALFEDIQALADERAAVNIALRTRHERLRKAAEAALDALNTEDDETICNLLRAALAEDGK